MDLVAGIELFGKQIRSNDQTKIKAGPIRSSPAAVSRLIGLGPSMATSLALEVSKWMSQRPFCQ
jgi:hypothetical protein